MKKLMEVYNSCLSEEKKKIDRFFLSSVNNYDYISYINYLKEINCDDVNILSQEEINEIFYEDMNLYISFKYNNNLENIYYEPITLEILNNDKFYNHYLNPIFKINNEQFFCKIINLIRGYPKLEKNKKQLIINLIQNSYDNYQNSYYNVMMLKYFEMKIVNYKLSLEELPIIIKYFIGSEAFNNNLNIEFKITRIESIIKSLLKLNLKFEKRKYLAEDKKIINDKKSLLADLKQYRSIYGKQVCKDNCNDSIIEINVSNFVNFLKFKEFAFEFIIDVIFHEVRHSFQNSGKDLKLKNEYERTLLFLTHDYRYYFDNHNYIFTEIDASFDSLEKRKELFSKYFSCINFNQKRYNDKKFQILVNYYYKRLEIDKKLDALLIENPTEIANYKTLGLEYEKTGYPKDILSILNEKRSNDDVIYDEIIIRSLNRLDNDSYIELIQNLRDNDNELLDIIDNALIKKAQEINTHLQFLEENYKNQYELKVIPYTSRICFFYLELLKIKNQNRVDKIYSK